MASAEEEVFGKMSLRNVLLKLPNINLAIVGEPTLNAMAIVKKGLLIFDIIVRGTPSYAAHPNDDNAIYKSLKTVTYLKNLAFEKVSAILGKVKLTVNQFWK